MWLPHTATVELPSDGGSGQDGGGISYGAPATVTCSIQPAASDVIVGDFGPDIEADYVLYARLSDLASFEYHARVTRGTSVYIVAARPKVWDQGLPTDHIAVALKGVQFA